MAGIRIAAEDLNKLERFARAHKPPLGVEATGTVAVFISQLLNLIEEIHSVRAALRAARRARCEWCRQDREIWRSKTARWSHVTRDSQCDIDEMDTCPVGFLYEIELGWQWEGE